MSRRCWDGYEMDDLDEIMIKRRKRIEKEK